MKTIKFTTALFALVISLGTIADVYVEGYTRSDGTEVSGHYRSDPNDTVEDNWSYVGNINPYTGAVGTNRYEESPTSEYFTARSTTNTNSGSSADGGMYFIILIIVLVVVLVAYTGRNSSTNPGKKKRKRKNSSPQYKTRVINENEFDLYSDEVGLIQAAIEKGRLIEFSYQKSGSVQIERRVIKPTNYVAFNNLCVQGICQTKNEERNFALINITNLKVIHTS